MTRGLETTFAVLVGTKNEAAVPILIQALDASDRDVRTGALRALLQRRSPLVQRELLRRWPTFSERWKSIVAEHPGRISSAVRDAILSTDKQLRASGCEAVLWIREFDLMPALITAAEDKSNPQADLAVETLLSLAEMLYEELAAPRDYRIRRDPQLVRQFVVGALEQSVERFDQHKRSEVVEAFLLLANRDNPVLKRILQNPHEKCYLTVVTLLAQSPRPGVMRLLLNYLDDQHVPTSVHNVLVRRRDVPFVRHLLRRIDEGLTPNIETNLRRIESLSWLCDDLRILSALNEAEQRGAVQLVMASKINRLKAFEVVRYVLRHGAVGGRRAASAALTGFNGAEANELALEALADGDPVVQANAVGQLRERGIPGAINRLVALVDSPHEQVREAVRKCLSEFNFTRFLAAFDLLEEEVRRNTGRLVKRVDPTAMNALARELANPSRMRRLRALDMAVAMDAVPMVEAEVIQLLADEDGFLRAAVARAMIHSDSPETRNALRELLLDSNPSVREAAEQTLQAFAAASLAKPPGTQLDAVTDLQPVFPPLQSPQEMAG